MLFFSFRTILRLVCCLVLGAYNPSSFKVYSLSPFIPLYIVLLGKYGKLMCSFCKTIAIYSLKISSYFIMYLTFFLKGLIIFAKYLFSVSSNISSFLSNTVLYCTGLSTFTILTSSFG